MGSDASSMAKNVVMGLAQAAAGYLTVSTAINLVKDSIAAAAEEETNLVSINATIKSMGLSSEISGEKIRSMTEAMQAANGVFAHDDLERAAQSFLKIEGFNPSNLQKVLGVVQDFAAGTGSSAADAAQSIANALETGQTKSLHFSKALRDQITAMIAAGDQAGALALIMDTLNSKYGGQAAAAMDTYNGKIDILKNNWGELLATLGGAALPTGKGLLSWLNNAVVAETQLLDVQQKFTRESWNALTPTEKMAMLFAPGGAFTAISVVVGALTTNLPGVAKGADAVAMSGQDVAKAWMDAHDSVDEFDSSAQNVIDYAKQLSNIVGYAHAYRTGIENVTKAENDLSDTEKNLHDLQVGDWTATDEKIVSATQKVDDMKTKLGEAQQASRDATNEMIAGFLQAQLTMDGVFDESDMNKVLNYRLQMGLLTQDEYNAALEALSIAENLAKIEDKTVNVNVVYSGVTGEIPTQALNRAGGGYVPPGASSIVGDWPGMTTGFEELIKALPGGGVQVYPHNQTTMPSGGAGGSAKTVNNNITVVNPTAEPASTSVSSTLRKLNYFGVT